MSENENYRGKRASEDAISEASGYRGKRTKERRAHTGIFHEPFSAYEDLDFEEVTTDGTAFDHRPGRHAALIESVYSTEIDGGDTSIPTAKNRRRGTLIGTGFLVALAASIGAYAVFSDPQPPASTGPAILGPVFAETYPDRTPTGATETIAAIDNGFRASEGSTLTTLAHLTLPPNEADCVVQGEEGYCLAGTVELPTSTGRVFYAGDLGVSPLVAETYEINELGKPTNTLVASIVANVAGSPTRFLAFMDGVQGDGWLVEIPLDTTLDQARTLADDFTYVA